LDALLEARAMAGPPIEEPPIIEPPLAEPLLPLESAVTPFALLPPAQLSIAEEPIAAVEDDDAALVEQLAAAEALAEFDGLEIVDEPIDEATLIDEPMFDEPGAIEGSAEDAAADDAAADEASADAPLDLEEFIVFSLADTRCVVPIRNVVEVGRIPDAAPVPNAPAWLHGLGNLRGQVLSLIDLRAFLGLGRIRPSAGRMIVLRADADEVVAGLMVDQVHQIVSLSPSRFQPAPATLPPGYGGFVWGVCEYGSHAMIGLDVDSVLGAETEQGEVALAG
jgi:purine-binding chemotaxis protein CheW